MIIFGKSSTFAFEIKPSTSTSNFYLGTFPQSWDNKTKYLDAIQGDYWVFNIFSLFLISSLFLSLKMMDVLGLEVGDDFLRSNSKKAVVDSGTSYLILSTEAFTSLWTAISGMCQDTIVGVLCPCVNSKNSHLFPQISIYGYGAKFVLDPSDYIMAYDVDHYF